MSKVIGSTTNDAGGSIIGVGSMAPLFEEFLLRGLLFGSIRHMVDEHGTVALTAGVFTLMHMQYDRGRDATDPAHGHRARLCTFAQRIHLGARCDAHAEQLGECGRSRSGDRIDGRGPLALRPK
jgi:hypothetical protein